MGAAKAGEAPPAPRLPDDDPDGDADAERLAIQEHGP
jgi:hypothetical protein